MVRRGDDVTGRPVGDRRHPRRLHRGAHRGPEVDDEARPQAVTERWAENLTEPHLLRRGVVPDSIPESSTKHEEEQQSVRRRTPGSVQPADRRSADRRRPCRPAGRRHLLPARGSRSAGLPGFDDRLRYVDAVDDAPPFWRWTWSSSAAPTWARTSCVATLSCPATTPRHRCGTSSSPTARRCAKVDCATHPGSPRVRRRCPRPPRYRHGHLRAATVRLIMIGGGPGTGKTTLARGLSEELGAELISTDDVRAVMVAAARSSANPASWAKLYAPRTSRPSMTRGRRAARPSARGRTVILDGTWSDPAYRERAARWRPRHRGDGGTGLCRATGRHRRPDPYPHQHQLQVTAEIATLAGAPPRQLAAGPPWIDTARPRRIRRRGTGHLHHHPLNPTEESRMRYVEDIANLGHGRRRGGRRQGRQHGEMVAAGLPVPPGFVVLRDSYLESMKAGGVADELNAAHREALLAALDTQSVDGMCAKMRDLVVRRGWPRGRPRADPGLLSRDGPGLLCGGCGPRPPARTAPTPSFAGMNETYTNCVGRTLIEAVQNCWASLFRAASGLLPGESRFHRRPGDGRRRAVDDRLRTLPGWRSPPTRPPTPPTGWWSRCVRSGRGRGLRVGGARHLRRLQGGR